MSRLLATLHDDDGEVAVDGLVTAELQDLEMDAAELAAEVGAVDGLQLIGTGSITGRMWAKPAISVLAIDAPPVAEAINQLLPFARAKVSMRTAPGQDPDGAMEALAAHLERNTPWGVSVTVIPGAKGEAHHLDTAGPTYDAFRTAFEVAWGAGTVEVGIGGSIPFVAALSDLFPEAPILMTGVGDPSSRWHGPNESQDLQELKRGIVAEAIALRLLADLPA